MSGFKTGRNGAKPPESPQALFRQLRPRNRNIRDLLSRQADVLRAYAKLPKETKDIALELPTGGGKTLVGLLLAEYRRLLTSEPVAYLCPTVQLARQVAAKADEYGMSVVTLTGPSAAWDPADRNAYVRGRSVAIATYSGLFNTHPKIRGGTLVLDDAHAGEGYVSRLWSIAVLRGTPLYASVLAALADGLPRSLVERLRETAINPNWLYEVQLVSPLVVAEQADLLLDALEAHADDPNDEIYWARKMLDSALEHCLVHASGREILIRPLIPPTAHHAPFADASQRIYMSATLGAGGELERAFGVEEIRRLAAESDSQQQGLGRRFFVVPGAARGPVEADAIIEEAINKAGRALVLAQSNVELDRFSERCLPEHVVEVRAREVEDTFDAFTGEDRAALLLANRYDGIDLPDDTCRLIVLTGLPAYAHLQERFFVDKLGARRVVSERVRTRITQGAGRCTRNAQDYAVVILRDDKLVDFCSREDEIEAMQPELQAELRFGLANSEGDLDVLELLEHFWTQDDEWDGAEDHIRGRVEECKRREASEVTALQASAPVEVLCWVALWRGDRREAIRLAQKVTDRLEGGDELRGYRALWLYLAAAWTKVIADETEADEDIRHAEALRLEAEAAAQRLAWFPRLRQTLRPETGVEYDGRAVRAVETLRAMQLRGPRFEREIAELEDQLACSEASRFELGLKTLGDLLGFEAERPPGQANPDGAWREKDDLWIVFEAKTNERPEKAVAPKAVRQALTHPDWIRSNLGWPDPARTLTVLVTPRKTVSPAAAAIAGDLYLTSPKVIQQLAESVIKVHRDVRARAPGQSDDQLAGLVARGFNQHGVTSDRIIERLGHRQVGDG